MIALNRLECAKKAFDAMFLYELLVHPDVGSVTNAEGVF